MRDAVREKVGPKIEARVREMVEDGRIGTLDSALELFDRMLPAEPLVSPAIDEKLARIVCAAPEAAAA